jgi:hypothetical protein
MTVGLHPCPGCQTSIFLQKLINSVNKISQQVNKGNYQLSSGRLPVATDYIAHVANLGCTVETAIMAISTRLQNGGIGTGSEVIVLSIVVV